MAAHTHYGCNLRPAALSSPAMGRPTARFPVQSDEEVSRERRRLNYGDIDLREDVTADVIDMHPNTPVLVTNHTHYRTGGFPTLGPAGDPTPQLSPSAMPDMHPNTPVLVTNHTHYRTGGFPTLGPAGDPTPQLSPSAMPGPPMIRAQSLALPTQPFIQQDVVINFVMSQHSVAMGTRFSNQRASRDPADQSSLCEPVSVFQLCRTRHYL